MDDAEVAVSGCAGVRLRPGPDRVAIRLKRRDEDAGIFDEQPGCDATRASAEPIAGEAGAE